MSARGYVERLIAKQCIADLLKAGYEVSVFDGEETTVKRSRDADAIYAAMFTADEDYLHVHNVGAKDHFGWVRFVYGNDGYDVINDYTTNLETVLADSNKLAREIDET